MTHPPLLALTRVSHTLEELASHIQEINNYNMYSSPDIVGSLMTSSAVWPPSSKKDHHLFSN